MILKDFSPLPQRMDGKDKMKTFKEAEEKLNNGVKVKYKGKVYIIDGCEGDNWGTYNVHLKDCNELGFKSYKDVELVSPSSGEEKGTK